MLFSIGNELLRGKTVNTNASDFGMKLTLCGYDVVRGTEVIKCRKKKVKKQAYSLIAL